MVKHSQREARKLEATLSTLGCRHGSYAVGCNRTECTTLGCIIRRCVIGGVSRPTWIVLVMQTDIGGDIDGATGLGGVEAEVMFAAFTILQGPWPWAGLPSRGAWGDGVSSGLPALRERWTIIGFSKNSGSRPGPLELSCPSEHEACRGKYVTGDRSNDSFSCSRWLWGFPLRRRSWLTLLGEAA